MSTTLNIPKRFKTVPVPAYRPYLVFPPIATRTIDETTQAIKLKNIIFLGRRTCNNGKNPFTHNTLQKKDKGKLDAKPTMKSWKMPKKLIIGFENNVEPIPQPFLLC